VYPQHSCHVDGFAFYNNVTEYFFLSCCYNTKPKDLQYMALMALTCKVGPLYWEKIAKIRSAKLGWPPVT